MVRLRGQPEEGFADIGGVMGWLEAQGLIEQVDRPYEDPFWRGWGDPYSAVASWRCDPWEPA